VKRILLFIPLVLAACKAYTPTPTVSSPSPMPVQPTVTPTPSPLPPTPTPGVIEVPSVAPEFVALDFVAQVCNAKWCNNGEYLICPGDPNHTDSGYVGRVDGTTTEGGLLVEAPALLTIPAYNGSFGGIFGQYPPFTIQKGDTFHAILACQQADTPCDVSFALDYFNEWGAYREILPSAGPIPLESQSTSGGGYSTIEIDLSYMAGQTVKFVLAVRDNGELHEHRALWIAPYIWRDPNYQPPATQASVPVPTSASQEVEGGIPGVIAGMVDMSSAPPYLNDPILTGGIGQPVVVVFFNLADGTWRWIHTTLTHPYYQMTVTPGDYHVVAYAKGVGDVPYVIGAYTGTNPSCGQPPQVVHVSSNAHINDIVIADWNWSCGGDAYRPAKPGEVPIP
jgi:hypothetical protein